MKRALFLLIATIPFETEFKDICKDRWLDRAAQIKCESNFDLHAKNKYSSASGEFQFINGSWFHYGKELWGEEFYEKNIWSSDNRELAWYVYTKYGTSDWNSSKSWKSGCS